MRTNTRCPNMNHGRENAPVRYCPMCGESVNRLAQAVCNADKHAGLRKQRLLFCPDCGKKLATV